jgi:transposase
VVEAGARDGQSGAGEVRYRSYMLAPHRDFVLAQFEELPRLTLHRLKDLLDARGIGASRDTVWRFQRREGRSVKKPHAPMSR